MRVGHQKKGARVFLASLAQAWETDSVELAVLQHVHGTKIESQDSGQSSSDAGGTHDAEITNSPFNAAPAAQKKAFNAAEKTACSIQAMSTAANLKPANNH